MKMRTSRTIRCIAVLSLAGIAALATAGTASADVTWENKETSKCLQWELTGNNGVNDIYAVDTGLDSEPWGTNWCGGSGLNNSNWNNTWQDPVATADGYMHVEQPSVNGSVQLDSDTHKPYCLDSNNQYGTYGRVYLDVCNGGKWQQWQELSTATGWALIDNQTKLVLDGATGPRNDGEFPGGLWAATNIGNGDTWARWS